MLHNKSLILFYIFFILSGTDLEVVWGFISHKDLARSLTDGENIEQDLEPGMKEVSHVVSNHNHGTEDITSGYWPFSSANYHELAHQDRFLPSTNLDHHPLVEGSTTAGHRSEQGGKAFESQKWLLDIIFSFKIQLILY